MQMQGDLLLKTRTKKRKSCAIIPLMSVKKVIQIGHPALKAENIFLENITSPQTAKLLKDLKDTMYKTGLIGIAGPQIAKNIMVFVTHPRNTAARKLKKTDGFRVYINPKITYLSKEQSRIYEGCGSVVGGELFGPVMRAKEVTVEAWDEKGDKFSLTCDGLLARVIQHEYDHIMGTEFIQKVEDYHKLLASKFYKKTIRSSREQKKASVITKIVYKKI